MDQFDYDNLTSHIKKYKVNLIAKIDTYNLYEDNLAKQADLLTLLPDYTPDIKCDTNKKFSIIHLDNKDLHIPEFVYKTTSGLSLNLETKQDDEDALSDKNSVDDKVKISKIALKLDKSTKHQHPNPIREITYDMMSVSLEKNEKELKFDQHSKDDNEIDDHHKNQRHKDSNDEKEGNEEYNDQFYDDDYDKAQPGLSKRSKTAKANTKVKKHDFPNTKPSLSKLTNIVNVRNKTRIYLLRTLAYIDIEISSSDSFYNLKLNAIQMILRENQISLKHTSPEAYEIRFVDDDDEVPNMDFPPMEDDDNVIQSKNYVFALIEKEDYNPVSYPINNLPCLIQGNSSNNNEPCTPNTPSQCLNIKIHFKINRNNSYMKTVTVNKESSLRNVLEYLSIKKLLNYKNIDLYYFTEHNNNEELDMDNEVSTDVILKYLPITEFDLYFKKFPDVPESISYSHLSSQREQRQDFSHKRTKQKNRFIIESLEEDNEDDYSSLGMSSSRIDYMFNDMTAGVYQEFEVMKIKKDKSKHERLLGVDLYNLYNYLPKNKAQHLLINMVHKGTKKPLWKIKDVVECGFLEKKLFYIMMRINRQDVKKMTFEVRDQIVMKTIVAKIRYLISMNQDMNLYNEKTI